MTVNIKTKPRTFDVKLVALALSDPRRLEILRRLADGKEQCACRLLLGIGCTQSTLSHHMKILVKANLVAARKDGKWVHYVRVEETMDKLASYLKGE